MENSQIQSTTDYGMFKIIGENRELNSTHLRALTASIANRNLLAQNPIIVNKKMEVIDGQHRLDVAKNNKWPIYYVVRDDASLDDVAMLNANVREWKLKDYVESFAKRGNKEYQQLMDYSEAFEMPYSLAARLLDDSTGLMGRAEGLMRKLRHGEFVAYDVKGTIEFGSQLHEIRPFIEGAHVWKESGFVASLRMGYSKGMKHDELMSRFKLSGIKLYKRPSTRDYVRQLEEVYNYKRREGKIFILMHGEDIK